MVEYIQYCICGFVWGDLLPCTMVNHHYVPFGMILFTFSKHLKQIQEYVVVIPCCLQTIQRADHFFARFPTHILQMILTSIGECWSISWPAMVRLPCTHLVNILYWDCSYPTLTLEIVSGHLWFFVFVFLLVKAGDIHHNFRWVGVLGGRAGWQGCIF